jgi:hypothetical protein
MSNKYDEKIEAAKRWLGDRYLLAQPINTKLKLRVLTDRNSVSQSGEKEKFDVRA